MADAPVRGAPRFGRYRVVGVVGAGGFATVHRARDDRLDADVAIKVLAENHSLDPEVRERFITEGQLLRRVACPELIAAHDLGETAQGQPFLVLEYADRGDLAGRVRALREQASARAPGWAPGGEEILVVARVVAAALGSLHRSAVVHRDLSPQNVLLRSTAAPRGPVGRLLAADEAMVLGDLGFSKDLAASSGFTVGGGTSGFMPPEQRASGVVDARSDIWAASALLVWLVTGAPPDDDGSWRPAVERQPYGGLAAVLRRGLSGDPARRHATAEDWLADVERALAPADPRGPAAGRRLRRAVGLAAAVLLAAAIGLGLGFVVDDGETAQTVEERGGLVRTARTAGDTLVAVLGPDHMVVGEPAMFLAEARNVSHVAFVAPDGRIHEGAYVLEVTASSPGLAEVRLLGTTATGEVLVATHTVDVAAEDR